MSPRPLQLSAWRQFPSHMQGVEFKQNTVGLLSWGDRVQSPRLEKQLGSVGKASERRKVLGELPKSLAKGWAV